MAVTVLCITGSRALGTLPVDELPLQETGPGVSWMQGVRVIDITTSIAGPCATMLLGDMGAEVVKIERLGRGDDARHWGPPYLGGESLWFLSANRNKKSVALDFAKKKGREVLYDLIREADVVVTNLLPKTQRKLEVDYRALRKINAGLIFVSITGFGLGGERENWACYDLIAEGYSGIMDVTGEDGGEPQKIGAPAADLLAATDAAFAVTAALFDRSRTGKGHHIDVSLTSSMTRLLAPRLTSYLGSGEVPRRSGGKDSVIAVYQAFDTADHPITLGLGNDDIWRRFWEVVGLPHRGHDPSTATNDLRRATRRTIVAKIQTILSEHPREHWLTLFRGAGIPAGPINRIDEVVRDENLLERGMFYAIKTASGRVPQVGTGMLVDDVSRTVRHPPPRLGQHTVQVLKEILGYRCERIRDLSADSIIGEYEES
jgi:crotonobetainyl-CoA:carnitine CoA-transferase CaiB-like acyl-CoA transferase